MPGAHPVSNSTLVSVITPSCAFSGAPSLPWLPPRPNQTQQPGSPSARSGRQAQSRPLTPLPPPSHRRPHHYHLHQHLYRSPQGSQPALQLPLLGHTGIKMSQRPDPRQGQLLKPGSNALAEVGAQCEYLSLLPAPCCPAE